MASPATLAVLLLGLAGPFAGCAATAPLIVVSQPGGQQTLDLDAWLAAHPLPDDRDLSLDELWRTEATSFHLVQVRTREPLHVHRAHDLVAVLQQGRGTLLLGDQTLSLRPGSVVSIPRGTPHAFINGSSRPAVASVLFAPPFDGQDTVTVEE